jgi:glycosyltransferase involved in cell wall biosynthesis
LARAAAAERRVVRDAALVVANTVPVRDAMRRQYPDRAARIIAVTNGFDREPDRDRPSSGDRAAADGGRFTIAYAGTIYLDRDPRPLFRAAARVIEMRCLDRDAFAIEFMGAVADYDGASLDTLAAECGVRGYVHLHPPAPRDEALTFMERAAMLVVLPQDSDLAIPAKLFEYARASAWVLALAGPGSATAQLLRGTDADVVAPGSVDLIAHAIDRRFVQFARGERARPLSRFEFLSREAQANLLFGALEALAGSPRKAEATRRLQEERSRIAPAADLPSIAAEAVHQHSGNGAEAGRG